MTKQVQIECLKKLNDFFGNSSKYAYNVFYKMSGYVELEVIGKNRSKINLLDRGDEFVVNFIVVKKCFETMIIGKGDTRYNDLRLAWDKFCGRVKEVSKFVSVLDSVKGF